MTLRHLHVSQLRNLKEVVLEISPGFNLFIGSNGSGKTSLLEAVYLLGRGRSFRTSLIRRIVQHDTDQLSVFGRIQTISDSQIPLGLMKDKQGQTRMKVGGENIDSAAKLAELLPLQLINPDSYRLLDAGSKVRRQFMDWGVFHVEHSFFPLWQRIQRTLKQRNAALKSHWSREQIRVWDQELIQESVEIHLLRQKYIEKLTPLVKDITDYLLAGFDLELRYHRGWNQEYDLATALDESWHRDVEQGYTHVGPHRADLKVYVDHIPAQDVLSRGQQKLLTSALQLAQGKLLRAERDISCLYLIDDLTAELDHEKRRAMKYILQTMNSQVFITSVCKEDLQDFIELPHSQMFHVERGAVTRVC